MDRGDDNMDLRSPPAPRHAKLRVGIRAMCKEHKQQHVKSERDGDYTSLTTMQVNVAIQACLLPM